MTVPLYPIDSVIPQRPPMALIDEIVAREADSIIALVTIRSSGLFFQLGHGIPSHVGLEWMAQACAAFAGAKALDEAGTVKVGFLLGTRNFQANRYWFTEGERLYVRARLEYRDDELANFACEIADSIDGPAIAKASLNVFHPNDALALIRSQASPPS